jgi:MFS family permease
VSQPGTTPFTPEDEKIVKELRAALEIERLESELLKGFNYNGATSFAAAAIFTVVFLVLAGFIGNPGAWRITVPVFLAALACGWVLGIFLSPYGAEEKKTFETWGRAVSVFLSGYVIAKLDRVTQGITSDTLRKEENIFRVCGAFVLFVSAAVAVFTARRYSEAKAVRDAAKVKTPR